MEIRDASADLLIPGAAKRLFDGEPVARDALLQAVESMTLSASGWRGIFAHDGDAESRSSEVSAASLMVALCAGLSFAELLRERSGGRAPTVAVGIDTRDTGPVLSDAVVRALVAAGCSVRYLFIVASPEIMAYVRSGAGIDGFVHVTASHNPVGYNGFKFGLDSGAVLEAHDSSRLIEIFRRTCSAGALSAFVRLENGVDPSALVSIYRSAAGWKTDAGEAYAAFSREVAAGSPDPPVQKRLFESLRRSCAARGLGILGELNGSARTRSIDREFLQDSGFLVRLINDAPGKFVHAIVPEGASLDLCRSALEELHASDRRFLLGYVPDNDGDRGNLVIFDERAGKSIILHAQEVFALACVSELSFLASLGAERSRETSDGGRRKPAETQRIALAANGPTSMRVDRIASAFGVEVHRAEVGEANVVGLARKLREAGYIVRILGEGANGGTIVHPASVRDPLNTLLSIAKLYLLRGSESTPGLFETWCRASGNALRYRPDFSLHDVLASLPVFTTTSAYEPRAVMKVQSRDHGRLKDAYEEEFQSGWRKRAEELSQKYGMVSWEAVRYEGTEEKAGPRSGAQGGSQRGGLKIILKDRSGNARAFMWQRGSATEPVWRILVDVEGRNPEAEAYLLAWQRTLVERADARAVRPAAG